MTTYYYFMDAIADASTRATKFDTKVTQDLDLAPLGTYIGTVYNNITNNVEVTFSTSLDDFNINVLNNLARIILYDGTVGTKVYTPNPNFLNRKTTSTTLAPTVNNDVESGYAVSSIVTTTSNVAYICLDNSVSAAVWTPYNTATSNGFSIFTTSLIENGANPYINYSGTNSLQSICTIPFPGSNVVTPNLFMTVLSSSKGNPSCVLYLINPTGGSVPTIPAGVIASISISSPIPSIETLYTTTSFNFGNLPTTRGNIRFIIDIVGSNNGVKIYSMSLN